MSFIQAIPKIETAGDFSPDKSKVGVRLLFDMWLVLEILRYPFLFKAIVNVNLKMLSYAV